MSEIEFMCSMCAPQVKECAKDLPPQELQTDTKYHLGPHSIVEYDPQATLAVPPIRCGGAASAERVLHPRTRVYVRCGHL